MRSFPEVMSAEVERAKALELVRLRHEAWSALLAEPAYASALIKRIQTALVDDKDKHFAAAELAKLASASKAHARTKTERSRARYLAAANALSVCLHKHPHEASLFRTLVRLVRGHEGELAQGRLDAEARRAHASALRRAESALSRARQRFVAKNLRLVATIARRYSHNFLSQEDLIQEGTLGLIRAVDGYDPNRGTRFSTYAGWWIRHGISRAIANYGLPIRVPANILSLRAQLVRAERQLQADGKVHISDAELARAVGAPVKTVAKARQAVLGQTEMPTSLVDDQNVDVDATLDWPIVCELLEAQVADLPGIEASIIRHRFPLDGRQPMTLAQLGEVHSLSRERIRQLEKRALQRMRGGFA